MATSTRPLVHGLDVDAETRCTHWHGASDIVAIRMFCCGEYYACRDCHAALASHPAAVWPKETWETPAVLCGVCAREMTVNEYLGSSYYCPNCHAAFNPRCSLHHDSYFAI